MADKKAEAEASAFFISLMLQLPAVFAAAVTAAAAIVSAAATAAALFLGLGFVDLEVTSVDLFAIEGCDSRFGFFSRRHFDESESARAAGLAVFDNVGRLDSARL